MLDDELFVGGEAAEDFPERRDWYLDIFAFLVVVMFAVVSLNELQLRMTAGIDWERFLKWKDYDDTCKSHAIRMRNACLREIVGFGQHASKSKYYGRVLGWWEVALFGGRT